MGRAFVFPGQGSQAVGMGRALAESSATARETFEEIDDALDFRLSHLMFEGPDDRLVLTENAQPAIMAAGIAALRVLEREGGIRVASAADLVAGHSLGEYTALAAADALDLASTARLLRLRGKAMQAAVGVGEGAMAAILGLPFAAVEAVTRAASQPGEACAPANDNAPGQVVISGAAAAVERAIALAKEAGARRAIALHVSAPFHCALMAPAADAMAEALSATRLDAPVVPLVANVTARAETDPARIRDLLVEQVTGLVRWRESVEAMAADGITSYIEFGGQVLAPILRRIVPDAQVRSVQTMDDIEAILKAL
jgi:[acyl-carrier-protein] S-malonyltransferase